jgi:Mn2+/Fe2+ NRAMP family transporter
MDSIKALVLAAILNGVVSVPIMAILMLLAGNRRVMGTFVVGRRLKWLGWLATGVMAVAVTTMFLLMP